MMCFFSKLTKTRDREKKIQHQFFFQFNVQKEKKESVQMDFIKTLAESGCSCVDWDLSPDNGESPNTSKDVSQSKSNNNNINSTARRSNHGGSMNHNNHCQPIPRPSQNHMVQKVLGHAIGHEGKWQRMVADHVIDLVSHPDFRRDVKKIVNKK